MSPGINDSTARAEPHATGPVLPRRPLQDDAEMDITPMIDITFLLLIFFLVAARLESEAAVALPNARYGTAVSDTDAVVLTVVRDGDRAQVYKGDGKVAANLVAASNLQAREEDIRRYVETELGGDSTRPVLIKAERDVKHREVNRVARAVGEAAADVRLYVAVMEVRE